jgi:hypothetical protein
VGSSDEAQKGQATAVSPVVLVSDFKDSKKNVAIGLLDAN